MDENWNTVNNHIDNIDDLKKIEFSPIKWVIVLDEWGVNINARRSSSDDNRIYGELWMLGRKLNADIVICAQLWRMIDVYFRELANYIFEMHAWFDKKDYLMFEARIYGSGGENIIKVCRFDLFEWVRLTGFTYNTLETSKIKGKEKKKKEDSMDHLPIRPEQIPRSSENPQWFAPLYTTEASEIIWRDIKTNR